MIGDRVEVGVPGAAPAGARIPSESALAGWLIVAGLSAAGAGLLAAAGGPGWALPLFLAVAVAAVAAYGPLIYRFYRRQEERLPAGEERGRERARVLSAAFEQLGAGDLVRADAEAQRLARHVSGVFLEASRALSGLAEQIQDSSIEVAAAADGVNQIASDLASGSSQQAASVIEITAAMEELARTAAQIAGNAARQAALAERAETSGDAGSAAVDEAVAGVEEVQKRISGIASRADALGTRSKEIYRVLDLITEIADETHILSLNAAIEASAAGAEGRRFGVVAEEVRRLAHRSQESVDSVRGLLDEFASSIRATIVATEEGSKEASRVLERSRSAAAAIGALREAAGVTARVARQISLATQQQNSASDEVVMTLREVSQVVHRMTGGLRQLSGTADRLNRLGLTIQLLAQSFHLDSPRSLKHLVEELAGSIERAAPGEVEKVLDGFVQKAPFLEMAYVADVRGRTLAVTFFGGSSRKEGGAGSDFRGAEWLKDYDLRQRPWFRAVAREMRTSLTSPYSSLQSGDTCFTVASPVRGPGGGLAAVLGVDVNVTGWTRL
ncbi:MAG TPA: methyl-accepting chemotaxis protein [Thermoanaerobaculia bacterium]|nr:methyl-accepting chemotaxis protein [Thermoanaerobaculia bacterium]